MSQSLTNILSFLSAGNNVGNLFHVVDDLGRAMETLVTVMTDDEAAE
uniref:Dystrophin n=1 Tax=Callorhinchus milii TaxID=7868 RepID=V9KRV3_CALMI